MSYHELMFLKAEALCRLNRDAEDALKEAVVAVGGQPQHDLTESDDTFAHSDSSLCIARNAIVTDHSPVSISVWFDISG